MKILKSIPAAGILALALFACPVFAVSGPWKDLISRADWSASAKPSVIDRKFDKKAVARFLDNWRDTYDSDPEMAEPPLDPERIDDFKWLDIDKDGVYELFVTYRENRTLENGPSIYKSANGKKYVLQHLPGIVVRDIGDVLEDLDKDGTPELVLREEIAGSTATLGLASPRPIWTTIYRWNGQQFEDASARFNGFYLERLLPQTEARIRGVLPRAPDPAKLTADEFAREQAWYELRIASLYVIRDKILRFTGQDPRAGIDRAREWAKSPSPELRRLAVDVFRDAGLRTYALDVRFIASDSDTRVSSYAKSVLATLSEK